VVLVVSRQRYLGHYIKLLLRYVTLRRRCCLKDLRKKRDEERQKQLRWREEHRNALLQGKVAGRDSSDTGPDSLPPGPPGDPPPGPSSGPPGGPAPTFDSGGRTRALYGVEPGRERSYRQKQWRQVRRVDCRRTCKIPMCCAIIVIMR